MFSVLFGFCLYVAAENSKCVQLGFFVKENRVKNNGLIVFFLKFNMAICEV